MAGGWITPSRAVLAGAAGIALVAVTAAVVRQPASPPADAPVTGAAPAAGIEAAIAELERRTQGTDPDPEALQMLGRAYALAERNSDAAAAFARAAAAQPDRAENWSALGEATVLAERNGVSPRAEVAFRRALSLDPKDFRARYFLAVRKDLTGDHRGAVDDWIGLLREAPADAPWAADVRALVTKVAADNRIDIAGRLPARSGPTPAQIEAGAALPANQQADMIRGMVEGLAARLASNPKDPDGWIRLMRARMVLGDPMAARKALDSARAANPDARDRLDEAARTLGIADG